VERPTAMTILRRVSYSDVMSRGVRESARAAMLVYFTRSVFQLEASLHADERDERHGNP